MSDENKEEVQEEAVETAEEVVVKDADATSEVEGEAAEEMSPEETEDMEALDDEIEDEEEEVEEETEEYKTPIDRLFFRTLQRNAAKRESKLRKHLASPIEFRIKEPLAVYSLDWSKEELVVSAEHSEKASCSVELSQKDLFEIVEGQLNPQVAMLSEKIGIKGDMSMAMYAFNLFVRRGRRK